MGSAVLNFILVIAVVVVVVVAYLYNRQKKKKITADEYLTARGSTGWVQIMFSMTAVFMGTWALFSPAESVIYGGVPTALLYAASCALAPILFAIIGVRIRRLLPNGSSATEFVAARFGMISYAIMALNSVFYMGVALTAELTGMSAAVQFLWGIPNWVVIIGILAGVTIYTTYGGLKASLFADTIQTVLIIPTLLVAFFATLNILGGWDVVWAGTVANAPYVVDWNNSYSWTYGIGLFLGILTVLLFDQTCWQRAWASKDDKSFVKAFTGVGLLFFPIILLACGFGIMALGTIEIQFPSIALFELLGAVAPKWLLNTVLVLAIALIMTTAGALLNGIASLMAVETKRVLRSGDSKKILKASRISTVLVAVICGIIALRGISVLYLYTIANLVVSASVFPMFYGLFNRKLKDTSVLIAFVVGLGVALIWLPDPTWMTGNLMLCLGAALVVPAIISVILGNFGDPIDFEKLRDKIIMVKEEEEELLEELGV